MPLRIIAGADTRHEMAEDMYDSIGWWTAWGEERNQVCHPIVDFDRLLVTSDSDLLDELLDEDAPPEERAAHSEAIEYAREAASAMSAVEEALADAVAAYERGDAAACLAALDLAGRAEGEYGDSPATDDLRRRLLEEEEDEEEE